MEAEIKLVGKTYTVDFNSPLDISIPVGRNEGPNAFHLRKPTYEAVEAGTFIGNVGRGGSCNCEDISFNPHGNGTHTEGAGHVSREAHYINNVLQQFIFPVRLISVEAIETNGQFVINEQLVKEALSGDFFQAEALVIRTLPNSESKKTARYSGSRPPYFTTSAIEYLNQIGIKHLLTDLPSLDHEDDPKLLAHHVFFADGNGYDLSKTVTEMVFVPDQVEDGLYLLNLQIAPFETDASPSKPVLYRMKRT